MLTENTSGSAIIRCSLSATETEKYAHVTFFFNGGLEKAHSKEDRELVPSPKVATYDLKPEMSADGVAVAVSCHGVRFSPHPPRLM